MCEISEDNLARKYLDTEFVSRYRFENDPARYTEPSRIVPILCGITTSRLPLWTLDLGITDFYDDRPHVDMRICGCYT